MMLDTDVNSLEARKTDLEVELNNLLKSEKKEEDKINELRSEILYLKKQIRKKLGPKEVEIQSRIKRNIEVTFNWMIISLWYIFKTVLREKFLTLKVYF